ncbi:uncharacterized protein LOC127750473 [Frankliniella occidentalis]|uniref:Uncharacterized protein LOC127750473 n=1 Tax=Frankliniella occidentalis TaxID=133901 RepID=A0A9C6XR04_FRAOC|nr:uncharacterized protein LOC127750473 [Frankliniella occidentalis]XP_052128141.1 uncharacterized protein LOC127750473 [Frankliniella occidentalis]XP_052128142.1 uncharacterized protein LOC127750473 [Frankliniella occidentalis]
MDRPAGQQTDADVDLLRPPSTPSPPGSPHYRPCRLSPTPPPEDDDTEDTMLVVPTHPYQHHRGHGARRMSATTPGTPRSFYYHRGRYSESSPTSSAPASPQRSRSPSPSPWLLSPGYEQYRQSLSVPAALEYGEASSDDLSSEWDSDVQEVSPLTPKVNGLGAGTARVLYHVTSNVKVV